MTKQIIINPDWEERKKEGYYWMKFYCDNCGCPNGLYQGAVDVMIQKGETSNYVLTCPNCKNETLKNNKFYDTIPKRLCARSNRGNINSSGSSSSYYRIFNFGVKIK